MCPWKPLSYATYCPRDAVGSALEDGCGVSGTCGQVSVRPGTYCSPHRRHAFRTLVSLSYMASYNAASSSCLALGGGAAVRAHRVRGRGLHSSTLQVNLSHF